MALTFQPPIIINAEQDNSQQAAFINQNFQNLGVAVGNTVTAINDILDNHSLYISEQGTAVIPSTSHLTGSISSNDAPTVTFTGTYTALPIVLSFIIDGFSAGETIGTAWGTGAFVPLSFGGTPIAFTEGYIPRQILSTTQVVFREQYINSSGSTKSNPQFTIQYFVIPQS